MMIVSIPIGCRAYSVSRFCGNIRLMKNTIEMYAAAHQRPFIAREKKPIRITPR